MEQEVITKLQKTTMSSHHLTHSRLKHFAKIAETSEDHISRIGMALSIKCGEINHDWMPTNLNSDEPPQSVVTGKQIRGSTLFKDDLLIFMALVNQHQQPVDYNDWRTVLTAHWERGTEILTESSGGQKDWIRILSNITIV